MTDVKIYAAIAVSALVTVGSYVWKKNTLASILAGTACYMILVQAVFPL